ncbi:MAG: hypothetical protein D6713_01940 [Deltaproteobacteria bacterium]|nr:MAG: hypothetical protein D6713_01940 [Deltaproteobacteria bacterium]
MHPSGRKSDYLYRLTCMDRAMEAGFDDVGIGALLGLYNWKFDVLATILHGHYLKDKYGTYPHTISVPRLKPAKGAVVTEAPHPVSDRDFLKIVALYRLTCPTSGVVISTREPAPLREESLFWGASQISAGSSTTPGGYGEAREREEEGQFFVDDKRPLKEVVKRVEEVGLIPSLCTSCYRSGRTGASFTSLAASGKMGKFCAVNALLTLAEYALDVLEGEEREKALALVRRESENLPPDLKRPFSEKLERVEKGERDVRF